jgi:glycosyltransferase involved in cell wall biosynthesis
MAVGRLIWLNPERFERKIDKSTWLEMGACLSSLGWDVTILTGGIPGRDSQYAELVTWVPAIDLPFVFRLSLLWSMVRWLRRNSRPHDVVLIGDESLWLVPRLKGLGIRYVHLDIRTLPVNLHRRKRQLSRLLFWRLPIRLLGRRVDGYSFITERLRDEIEKEFGLGIDDYAIWHSAVDTGKFKPVHVERQQDGNKLRLFYHGSISRRRGIGLVIDAIALGGLDPELEFVIVGDGPERKELEAQARDAGVADQVKFLGRVPYEQIVDQLSSADVCICPLPDLLEWNVSSPLKVFEYLACAKPIIATPIDAHIDVLKEAPFVVWTGGYEPADFNEAISSAFLRLAELKRAAESAPELVRDRYEWHVQARSLHRYVMRRSGRDAKLDQCAGMAPLENGREAM